MATQCLTSMVLAGTWRTCLLRKHMKARVTSTVSILMHAKCSTNDRRSFDPRSRNHRYSSILLSVCYTLLLRLVGGQGIARVYDENAQEFRCVIRETLSLANKIIPKMSGLCTLRWPCMLHRTLCTNEMLSQYARSNVKSLEGKPPACAVST